MNAFRQFCWPLVLILQGLLLCIAASMKTNELDILDGLLRNYDRRANPTHNSGNATLVTIEMFLRSFGSFNPASMAYEVDLYLRQSWRDERLRVENISHDLDLNDPKLVQMIWKPDVFFPNAKDASFQYVTVPNVLVRIKPDGLILYMLRLKLTFSCMMDLAKYPLDRQICSIELSSFARSTRELRLEWAVEKPLKMFDGLKLPQFELQEINPKRCDELLVSIGEFSCIKAEFVLDRSVGYHLVQSYLPTSLIVVISWVAFWLDIDAIPARVTLGVTTLLTISSESTGIRANLPPVSYIKALDVWMGTCTFFVFAALLEFTFVNYLFRRKIRLTQDNIPVKTKWTVLDCCHSMSSKSDKVTLPDGHPTNQASSVVATRCNCYCRVLAKRVDTTCRAAFPVAFLLFNILYWSYYL